jgi:hypothetical protein
MRKLFVIAALIVGLTVPVAAYAADLNPNQENQFSCPYGGTWHFVNVQTGGATAAGYFTVNFTGGDVSGYADRINRRNQHWTISGTGTLTGAESNLDGFIVLSDYTCKAKKSG